MTDLRIRTDIDIIFRKLVAHRTYPWNTQHECHHNRSVGHLLVYTSKVRNEFKV